jgi:hypothetical protein
MAYNAAAQQVSPRAKIDLPDSPNDRRDTLMEKDRQTLDAARQAEAERQALMPRPQTADEEYASRQRAKAASEVLGGGQRRRVSQTLTSADNTLAGTSAWGV